MADLKLRQKMSEDYLDYMMEQSLITRLAYIVSYSTYSDLPHTKTYYDLCIKTLDDLINTTLYSDCNEHDRIAVSMRRSDLINCRGLGFVFQNNDKETIK